MYDLRSFATVADEATIHETDKIKTVVANAIDPVNIKTNNAYTKRNRVELLEVQTEKHYTSNIWGTFNQLHEKGYRIKKGEHGVSVFCGFQPYTDEEGNEKRTPKFARVFNLDQTTKAEA